MELTTEEGRVLGALVEKELTTPQGYPLTDNALVTACNQTTSRDPIVSYDVATVRVAVRSLREQGLVRTVHRTGERSDKHKHELPTALDLSLEQVAVLAVLLLRGPQTAAEVRARTERMHAFGSAEEVERVLGELAGRGEPLVVRLERQPGRKEARWAQLLAAGGTAGGTEAATSAGTWSARSDDDVPPRAASVQSGAASVQSGAASVQSGAASVPPGAAPVQPAAPSPADVAALADEVAQLREEVASLREQVEALQQVQER